VKNIVLLDLNETLRRRRKSRAAHYRDQKQRLFPQGVKVGKRAVAWPAHEVDEILAAQLAGATDTQLKNIVIKLESQRKIEPIEEHAPNQAEGRTHD
jgi:prophage regulatory protein